MAKAVLSGAAVTPNAQLSAYAEGYEQPVEMIGERIMPAIAVDASQFSYLAGDKDAAFRVLDTLVGDKSNPNRISLHNSWVPGIVQAESLIADESESKVSQWLKVGVDLRETMTRGLLNSMGLAMENRTAGLYFAEDNYDDDKIIAPDTAWNNVAGNPINDIVAAARLSIYPPNTIAFGAAAWAAFLGNPYVIKTASGTQDRSTVLAETEGATLLARYGFKRVLVGLAKKQTEAKKQKGVQTYTLSDIWGENVSISYQDLNVAPGQVDVRGFAARFFLNFEATGTRVVVADWNEPGPGGANGVRVVKVSRAVLEKVVEKSAGVLLKTLVTAK